MNRKAAFPTDLILKAARDLVVESGPKAATMAAIAARMGGPTGSIYHRFPSRAALFAVLWLDAAERFQNSFESVEPSVSSWVGVTFDFCRQQPEEASVLLRHRVGDFLNGQWPKEYQQRAQALQRQLADLLRKAAEQCFKATDASAMRRVRLALCDIPLAAVRPHLEAGDPIPGYLKADATRAAVAILGDEHG